MLKMAMRRIVTKWSILGLSRWNVSLQLFSGAAAMNKIHRNTGGRGGARKMTGAWDLRPEDGIW